MNKNVIRIAHCACGTVFKTLANRDIFCSLHCRFFNEVDQRGDDQCWPWLGSKDKDGYGRFRFRYKIYRSNRVALGMIDGFLDEGQQALHSCDNPTCCNPKHIWSGTNVDNVKDRHEKGRTRANPNAGDNGRRSKRDKRGRFKGMQ